MKEKEITNGKKSLFKDAKGNWCIAIGGAKVKKSHRMRNYKKAKKIYESIK